MKTLNTLLLCGLFAVTMSAQATDETDPSLTNNEEFEGQAVECQKCEATQSSPIDRDDDSDAVNSPSA